MAWKHSQTTAWTVAAVAVIVAVLLTLFVASRPWQKAAEQPVDQAVPEKPEPVPSPTKSLPTDSGHRLTPEQQKRIDLIDRAMSESVDLSSMSQPSYKLRQTLTILQDIISSKMKEEIKLFVNHDLFPNPAEAKEFLDKSDISSKLFQTIDNKPLRKVTFQAVLENVLGQVKWTFKIKPEHVEIIPLADSEKYLTPEQQDRVDFFDEAMNETVDFSAMTKPSYKLGQALLILQDIINAKMKTKDVRQRLRTLHRGWPRRENFDKAVLETDIKLYLNHNILSKPDDNAWATLNEMDANLNLFKSVNENETLRELTFKTVLGNVLRQVGWTFKITPDYLEIIPLPHSDKYLTLLQEKRVEFIKTAMNEQVDLKWFDEYPDCKLGLMLSVLQDLISVKMKKDIKLYVNYSMFVNPADTKTMLKETGVDLGIFKNSNGGKMPRNAEFGPALDLVLRQANWTYRVTPDFVEIIPLPHAER